MLVLISLNVLALDENKTWSGSEKQVLSAVNSLTQQVVCRPLINRMPSLIKWKPLYVSLSAPRMFVITGKDNELPHRLARPSGVLLLAVLKFKTFLALISHWPLSTMALVW